MGWLAVPKQVPLVEYLVLNEGGPYLVAKCCDACGALYFDRRNACGRCGRTAFSPRRLADEGRLRSFTIVHRAAPNVPTPYVSAVVELDGGGVVKANLVDIEAEPGKVRLGMPLRLATFVAGTDDDGTEAVAFGFTPA
jgi:uncharacterized OB-fold protein